MFSLSGFGFVRFGEQSEQMISLTTMQGRVGLGDRPMKVSIAYAKGKDGSIIYPNNSQQSEEGSEGGPGGEQQPPAEQSAADYAAQWEQYNQYWSQYAAWQQWYAAQAQAAQTTPAAAEQTGDAAAPTAQHQEKKPCERKKQSIFDGNLKEAVQNRLKVDYEALNQEFLERSEELFTAMEDSRWSLL